VHGLGTVPSLGNFVYAVVGDGFVVFEELLQLGVIVRPLTGFGSLDAIRVSVGTADENAFFADALGQVLSRVS
jgi:histidinol-phosphate aminotransferase